jgi:hypothetical protein
VLPPCIECERIIIYLLLEDVFHPKIVYTAYTTIVYFKLGPKGPGLVASQNPRARVSFPKRKQVESKKSINPLAVTDEGGWITAKSAKTTTKPKSRNTKQKAKASGKGKSKAKTSKATKKVSNRKSTRSKVPTIVEINSSSSSLSSESEDDDVVLANRRSSANKKKLDKLVITDDTSDDSDYECSD